MITVDELVARLREGASPDDLASEMTDILNSAIKENQKEDHKKAAAQHVADAINDFVDEFYPDLCDTKISGEDIIPLVESVKQTCDALKDIAPKVEKFVEDASSCSNNARGVLNDFFEKYGL